MLPALLASNQAADISDFEVDFRFYTVTRMIDLATDMAEGIFELVVHGRNKLRPPPIRGGIQSWSPGLRQCDETPPERKSGGIHRMKSMFNLPYKKTIYVLVNRLYRKLNSERF